jgi:6-phosphogluconolactonase
MRKIYAFVLLSALAVIAGCSSGSSAPTTTPTTTPTTPTTPATPAPTSALYTQTNATTGNEVLAYSRASNGSLTSIGSYSTGGTGQGLPTYEGATPIPVGGASGAVALNPAGTLLYAVDAGSNDVAAFSVATDGTLTFIANYPTGGTAPGSITIDSTGKYLYVLNTGTLSSAANGDSGGISGFTIGSSGALTAIAGSTQPLSTASYASPSQVAFAPDGSYLMVTEKVSGTVPGTIDIYPVSAGVAAAPVSTPSTGTIPFGFAFTPTGVAVVSNAVAIPGIGQGTATSYTATAQGVLTVVSASVADNQAQPCWFALNPAGTIAYTTNSISGSVSAYAVSSTGVLTLVPPPTGASSAALIADSAVPTDDIVTPDGAYLYVIRSNAGAAPGQIVGFSISSAGALTSITGGVTGLPEGSLGLAVR